MNDFKSPWDEMVLEVIEAAQKRIDKKDFDLQCRLTPPTNGKSYFDRIKVYEKLVTDKIIEIDNGTLKISKKEIPEWLLTGLKKGSESSWEIFEKINPSNKTIEKVDHLLLEEIGLAGEKAVINILKKSLPEELHFRLKHVSLFDDSVGFDIQTPSLKNNSDTLLLEIKTSSRPGSFFNFFISRNETRIASLNENWILVGVFKKNDDYNIVGTLSYDQFSSFLPVNVHPNCRWESSKVVIPVNFFTDGLP
jgi:hypothetical protein